MRALIVAAALLVPGVAAAQITSGSSAATYAVTDRSGTITVGATAQALAPARVRHGCFVQNQSNTDLWLSAVGTAAPYQPSVWLPAGSSITCDVLGTPQSALSIYGAVTGQAFAAREW